jgi:DNA-binding MurR/RpiR family transcriptional regulator
VSGLVERLQRMSSRLSPAERQASEQLLGNYEDLPFLTADAIARMANVSASTVTRLASKLGYNGFPDLQLEAQSLLKERLSSTERVRRVVRGEPLESSATSPSLEQNLRLLLQFAEDPPLQQIRVAAELTVKADAALVVGFRAASPIAYFLYLGLSQLLGQKIRIASDAMLAPELTEALTAQDVLIAISFPRYALRTVEMAAAAQEGGAKVIAITNSVLSPLAAHAHVVLTCPFVGRAFQNSLIAAYALADVLVEQVVVITDPAQQREIERRLERTERLLRQWRWLYEIDRSNAAE